MLQKQEGFSLNFELSAIIYLENRKIFISIHLTSVGILFFACSASGLF